MPRTLPLTALAARVTDAPPRLGTTRLVCVDGPSGSGKTVLAAALAPLLAAPYVLHLDDLYPGWDGLADAVPLLHDSVVAPLADGRPAAYRRYDWGAGAYAEEHVVPPGGTLLVEGVGAGARLVAAHASLLVWVEAPRVERMRRGIARDGAAYRPHWERWAVQEDALFAAEGTRDRADVRVDGHPPGARGSSLPDPRREVVLLDGAVPDVPAAAPDVRPAAPDV